MKESLKVVTADGVRLSATHFSPHSPNGKVVLISSATGVRQGYYHDFAGYLAQEGFHVYTYDYRGIGKSRPASLRSFTASMQDWGMRDYQSMLQNILQTHPGASLVVFGHSVGGQLIGFSALSSKAAAVVMVGAQTPFWKHYEGWWMSLRLLILWYIAIPLLTKVAGYFPASRLGLFEDLPAQVARQWARWAKNRNYAFEELPDMEQKFGALKQPSLMISFSDDRLAPMAAVRDLMHRYQQLKWHHWHLDPDDVLQKRIGHFGFFKKKMQPTLWKETVEWMNAPANMKQSRAA